MQSVTVKEIVIVDGTRQKMDDDAFKQSLEGSFHVTALNYIHAPQDSGLPAARNRGVRCATGEIVQFLDDDAMLAQDYFEKLLPVFDASDVGAAAGLVIEPGRRVSLLKKLLFRFFYVGPFRQNRDELFLRPANALRVTNTLPGVGAYRKQIFNDFQFDEQLKGPAVGEDLDFSYRVGKRWLMVIEPSAKVYHYPSMAARGDLRATYTQKVMFYNYHYTKNIHKSFFSMISYLWLNVGFLSHSLTTGRVKAVLGVFDGICNICQRRATTRS